MEKNKSVHRDRECHGGTGSYNFKQGHQRRPEKGDFGLKSLKGGREPYRITWGKSIPVSKSGGPEAQALRREHARLFHIQQGNQCSGRRGSKRRVVGVEDREVVGVRDRLCRAV